MVSHQNKQLDDQKSFMASSSSASNKALLMVKTNQLDPPPPPPPPPHQHPLKCPRCDSSNTKFCYYNNYSLSQPRHFCKACKRYWTRGGTLRNVPVGGGCRKNKRVKRHQQPPPSSNDAVSTNPSVRAQIDLTPNPSHINNSPLFYNPLELNFPFSSFRVSSDQNNNHNGGGFDQINGVGLGFSSNGFKQDVFTGPGGNNPFSFFGSSSSTMASLLASGLQQQKSGNGYSGFMAYEDTTGREAKLDRIASWNPNPDPNPDEQINVSSDPSSLLWNNTWFDASSNLGSSVPSLI